MGNMGFFGLVHLAFWVYAVVQILGSAAGTDKKILWIVIVAILPLIGIILWYFMGPGSPK